MKITASMWRTRLYRIRKNFALGESQLESTNDPLAAHWLLLTVLPNPRI